MFERSQHDIVRKYAKVVKTALKLFFQYLSALNGNNMSILFPVTMN